MNLRKWKPGFYLMSSPCNVQGFFFPQSYIAGTLFRVSPSALSIHEPRKLTMLNNFQFHTPASIVCMGQVPSKPY